MNHDITHCSGEYQLAFGIKVVCEKRSTCHRYIAYLEAKNLEWAVSMCYTLDCITKKHALYWEENND